MRSLLLLSLLLAACLCCIHAQLHAVRIDATLSAEDQEHVVFVESASDSAAESEAAFDAEATDPQGHSPFRVKRVDIEEVVLAAEEAHEDGPSAQHTTLLEHSAQHAAPVPAQHQLNIPLTRSIAAPKNVEEVLLSIRERHVMHASDESYAAFVETGEHGASQEEMEHDAAIEEAAADAHDASELGEDTSALEVRSRDVPLYQEVLKEKHLATYYGLLSIGGTSYRVLFDTGSCELWVPSEACKTARCRRHKRFPLALPAGVDKTKKRMNIEYISGKVAGPMVSADVSVGGLVVPKQFLGLAERVDIELLDDVVWEGVLGLAYPSRSLVTRGVTPLFDNIMRSRLLTNPAKGLANQFAYYIDDQQGQMTFGGVNCDFVVKTSTGSANAKDIEACKSSFVFAPVTRKTYWTVTLGDVSLSYPKGVAPPKGSKLSGNCGKRGCRAIVDTGTYLLYTSKFFRAPEAWASFAHCADTSKLPNITFHIRTGKSFRAPTIPLTLEPREYVLKFDNSAAKEDCVVGISPDKDAVFTLGQVFLRAYYTLFDRDENRIGFSKIHRKGHDAVNAKASVPPPSHV